MNRFSIKNLLCVTTISACLFGLHVGTVSGVSTALKRAPHDLACYRGMSVRSDKDRINSRASASYFAPCIVEVEVEVYGAMKAGCKQYYVSVFGFCFLTPIRRDDWTAI